MLSVWVVHPRVADHGKSMRLGDVAYPNTCADSSDPLDVGLEDVHQALSRRHSEGVDRVPVLPSSQSLSRNSVAEF